MMTGLRSTKHFPSLADLCRLRCFMFSVSAALLSINIKVQMRKTKKQQQTKHEQLLADSGLGPEPPHASVSKHTTLSQIDSSHKFKESGITVFYDPQHNRTFVFLKIFRVI